MRSHSTINEVKVKKTEFLVSQAKICNAFLCTLDTVDVCECVYGTIF